MPTPTKAELETLALELYNALCDGQDDSEIADAFGLSAEVYQKLKSKALDDKAEEIRGRPQEHTYVLYIIEQIRNMRELDTMLRDFRKTKQYNAMLGALKLRSDLTDKILTRGQEFGIIAKKPDRKEIVGGIVIRDLTNEQLKRVVQRELKAVNEMMGSMDDTNILDVELGAIHHGPALPPATEGETADSTISTPTKHARAKTSKTSAKARGRPKQRVD